MTEATNAAKKSWPAVYWFGVLLTAGCILLVLVGQSEVFHAVEHTDFPLSWTLAGLAVVAFTVAEICQEAAARRRS